MKNDNTSGATFTFSGPMYNYGTMSGDVVNHFHGGELSETDIHEGSAKTANMMDSADKAAMVDSSGNAAMTNPSGNSAMTNPSDALSSIPTVFTSSDSITLMQKLIDHHLMDEQFQPIGLTWSERSILVDELSARLHIVDKWQTFGTLWHQKPQALRSAYNKAMEQKKTSAFFDKIRSAMEA